MKLASDLDNTDFVGASNPDSRLAVRFYKRAVQNDYESEAQRRPIFHDVDFVEIRVPGDTTFALDVPARDDHKRRFPLHWAHYLNTQGGEEGQVGTSLEQWPRLSKSQVEELRALKFTTVEQIASASDAQLQRIGMVAGMSPFAFRDHALRFLKLANDDSSVSEAETRAKALEEQLAAQAKVMAEMQEKLAELSAPKKRGPKRKELTE